jgi:protein-S-isoprenylcysteine O-methyltransferase Ste14
MHRPLPPTYLLASLVALGGLYLLLPGPQLVGAPWRYVGVLPIGLGVWLNVWADGLFKTRGTEVKPFRDSTALVTNGPYRVTRHPMYLGMLLIVLGAALVAGAATPFVVPVVLWWLLTAHFVIPEEAAMRRQFGSQYERYARQVRRWLGRRGDA